MGQLAGQILKLRKGPTYMEWDGLAGLAAGEGTRRWKYPG